MWFVSLKDGYFCLKLENHIKNKTKTQHENKFGLQPEKETWKKCREHPLLPWSANPNWSASLLFV